ncbi:MAG: glycosyltransferase [Dehalococcoidia bacterium]|nr:glycosyltransferase [Dehalococcoidia bacterium]
MSPTVSVIICCYTQERLRDMREAVASVQRQTRPPEQIVLAVDSNRDLYECLRSDFGEPIRVVLNAGAKGLSATRNVGIAAAQGDLVAFLDDDAVAEAGWLANLIAAFEDPEVHAAGGRAVLDWVEGRPPWLPEDLDWTVGGGFTWLPPKRTDVRNPHGHNMCFRREVFTSVGWFDGSLGRVANDGQAGEEAELCLRLKRRVPRATIVYEPASVIRHKVRPARGTWRYFLKRSYEEGLCKARIEQLARAHGVRPLSTESAYLRHLLFRALPSRLVRFWRLSELTQAAAIVACISAVGVGHAVGRWRFRQIKAAGIQDAQPANSGSAGRGGRTNG